jgi:hypothetical protein
MSIISVVRELAACLVSGCVGVAIAPPQEKKRNINNYLFLYIFRSPDLSIISRRENANIWECE